MATFEIQPSAEFLSLQRGCVAVVIVLLIVRWSVISLAMAVLMSFAFLYLLYRQRNTSPLPPICLFHDDNGWRLRSSDGVESAITLQRAGIATPFFLLLQWQHHDEARAGKIVIWRDALSESDFRHLSRLYWSEKFTASSKS